MIEQPADVGQQNSLMTAFSSVLSLYRDGFRSMTVGRTLWKIIIIKLLVMFGVLKVIFFPDYLNSTYETEAQKAAHVLGEITAPAHSEVGRVK